MLLLDTHTLIWVLVDDRRLGADAIERIESVSPVYYSSISQLEIELKRAAGKLSIDELEPSAYDELGLRQLPFVAGHARLLSDFPELIGHDPFDRALVAQAASEGLPFLTADRRLLALGRDFIVDATV